jgi:microcystin-dependent protein
MACSNCFNGCSDTTSDQCVKYTGINIPTLGISNGDTLAHVEKQLAEFLQFTMVGTGITPELPYVLYCDLIINNLPPVGPYTLNHVLNALILSACDLDTRVNGLTEQLALLDAPYTVPGCISGITGNEGTHVVLQAALDAICEVSSNLEALALNLYTNYLPAGPELDAYLSNYFTINPPPPNALMYFNMVPFTVVEYYGSLANFDLTGAGIGNWINIYLCNGQNGTPDKRGRVSVGATTMTGAGMSPIVDPSFPGNPTYALGETQGENTVTLGLSQMPGHTHTGTVTIVDPGHTHTINGQNNNASGGGSEIVMNNTEGIKATTNAGFTGITATVVNDAIGGSSAHNNVQPGIGAYFIMYIPAP